MSAVRSTVAGTAIKIRVIDIEITDDGRRAHIESGVPITCPICRTLVPAATVHRCGTGIYAIPPGR